jgi:hypothetical protein
MKWLTGAALGALLVATSSMAALAAGTTANTSNSNSPQTAARNPTTDTGDMSGSSRHTRRAAHRDQIGDRLTDALNLLAANGYTNIQTIDLQGDQIVAVATLNGRSVRVAVDPQTHQIVDRG